MRFKKSAGISLNIFIEILKVGLYIICQISRELGSLHNALEDYQPSLSECLNQNQLKQCPLVFLCPDPSPSWLICESCSSQDSIERKSRNFQMGPKTMFGLRYYCTSPDAHRKIQAHHKRESNARITCNCDNYLLNVYFDYKFVFSLSICFLLLFVSYLASLFQRDARIL